MVCVIVNLEIDRGGNLFIVIRIVLFIESLKVGLIVLCSFEKYVFIRYFLFGLVKGRL